MEQRSTIKLLSRLLALFAYLLLVSSRAAVAQTNAITNALSGPISLAEAQRTAFERNWDLLAAQSDVDLSVAQRIVAKEFPNPTLALSTTKIDTDRSSATHVGSSFWDRSYDSIVAVNQLFEIGGKRSSRKQSAAAGAEGAEARLQDARRILNQAIAKAYIGVLLADMNVQILRRSADSLRNEARIAETRFKAGDISLADRSQIEIAARRLELDADAARANAVTARIAVERLMGSSKPEGAWEPVDALDNLASTDVPLNGGLDVPRPDWAAAEANLRKAEADAKLQKAMRVPDPTVFVQYEHEPPDQPNTVGVGVSFPLPLWNHNRGNIIAAEAARKSAESQVAKTRANIAAEIVSARVAYESAESRLRQYQGEILTSSSDILKTVSFAYQKGGASLLDLLSAQRNDNDVRLAAAQAAADKANAAADLRAALNLN
jgi:cobalt-zinc-cadmium efflux system outer membrane protein